MSATNRTMETVEETLSDESIKSILLLTFINNKIDVKLLKPGLDSTDVFAMIPLALDMLFYLGAYEGKDDIEFAKFIDKEATIVLKDWLHKKLSAQTEA